MTTPNGEIDPDVMSAATDARNAARAGDTTAVNEALGRIADLTSDIDTP